MLVHTIIGPTSSLIPPPDAPAGCLNFTSTDEADSYQLGSVYPLCPPYWRPHYFLLPSNQTDQSGSRNGHFYCCRDGGRLYHTPGARASDQGDAGVSHTVQIKIFAESGPV